MPTPFEDLFDELETLDELLNEGPEVGSDGFNKSADFLRNIRAKVDAVGIIVNNLTDADVDDEFTEESDAETETSTGNESKENAFEFN